MYFFHGLDNAKYGTFKMAMLNRWATAAVKPLKTPDVIYRLAESWVKQPTCFEGGGYATTYMSFKEEAKAQSKEANPKETRTGENANGTKEAITRTEEGAKGPVAHSDLQVQVVQPLLHVQ